MTTFRLRSGLALGAYRLHQHVYETFEPPQGRRLLYYRDGEALWVQCDWRPDPNEARMPPGTFLQRIHATADTAALFPEGCRLRFRLRANPTWRDAVSGKRHPLGISQGAFTDGVREELARLGVTDPTPEQLLSRQLAGWLERRLAEAGEPSVVAKNRERVRDQGREWVAVDYEGGLVVRDANCLARLVRDGVGAAKGFGFGMLRLFQGEPK